MKRKTEMKTAVTIAILLMAMALMASAPIARASGTIYIKADGSIDPPTAPIQRVGDVYTFTNNIYDSIVIQKDNIVVSGAGYTVQGTGGGRGLSLSGRSSVTIKNMGIKDFWFGIWLNSSSSNSISSNTITKSEIGVWLDSYSDYNNISNNTITNNEGDGIFLGGFSDYNSISNNTITNNPCGIMVYYYSNYNSIFNNNIINSTIYGIRLDTLSNNSIFNNTITDHGYCGITLGSSSNNSIFNNTITNNGDRGIEVSVSSNYNSIFNNNITDNSYGIDVSSSSYYNSIFNNTITNNGDGIWLAWLPLASYYNSIFNNNITDNSYGISLYEASYNRIYHNNFIDNENHVYTRYSGNTWDDGYPSGGNYWSDYTGVDLYSGPSQNETGSDGLGDTPYVIDAYNRDRYPLMKTYPWAPHDIGITALTASKTVIGQGYNASINAMLFNYGDYTETFNVTLYANTTTIETKTNITLTSGNSTTITFLWNTTGIPKGNYTISANATILPGETDTTDNTLTDGIVTVTIPGDVNADCICDMADISMMIDAFMTHPGDPNWNSNCDVYCDDVVDMADINIAIDNFMKTCQDP